MYNDAIETANMLKKKSIFGSARLITFIRRVTLVAKPVINHDIGKDREVVTTNGTYSWSFVTQLFRNG